MANNVKGNAKATPNPAMPCVKAHAPPCKEPTNKVPKIGPVQEKETMAKVMAIKNMPPILPSPLFESALLAMPLGKDISKNPKNEILKTMNIIKKIIFNHGLVEILLKISGCTLPTTWNGTLAKTYTKKMLNPYKSPFTIPCFFVLDRFVKKETVTGIMGNTQGVMSAMSPPKNPRRNTSQPDELLVVTAPLPQASSGAVVAVVGNNILNPATLLPLDKATINGSSNA